MNKFLFGLGFTITVLTSVCYAVDAYKNYQMMSALIQAGGLGGALLYIFPFVAGVAGILFSRTYQSPQNCPRSK